MKTSQIKLIEINTKLLVKLHDQNKSGYGLNVSRSPLDALKDSMFSLCQNLYN
jgi:hypothetical protein